MIEWCSAKLYKPKIVHTALLQANWLEGYVHAGTMIIMSSEEDLKRLQDENVDFNIFFLNAPKIGQCRDNNLSANYPNG